MGPFLFSVSFRTKHMYLRPGCVFITVSFLDDSFSVLSVFPPVFVGAKLEAKVCKVSQFKVLVLEISQWKTH